MKIIKILMAAIVVIALATNVGATYLLTEYNPPLVIVGQMHDLGTQVKYYYNVYDEMDDAYINVTAESYIGYTATWISAILPETLYFWSYKLEPVGSNTVVSQTGELQKNEKQYLALMPGSTFSVIDPAVDRSGNITVEDTINVLPDDYYSMFYDKDSKMISYIMYIPQEYYNENKDLMQHSYILQTYGSHVSGTHNKHYIREYSGLQIRGAYSAVLNEILTTLKDMTGGGTGGLTEDQINAAVKDALDEYAEQERTEVQSQGQQADQLVEQLGDIVPAAKLQTALQGLTAAVSGNHRTCVLVLPELIEPVTGAMIMEETPIDLTGTIQGIINGDSRIAMLVDLIRWINLLVLAFSLYRSIMNIINYVTSGGDQA